MQTIDYIIIVLKVIVSLSILNVWLIQPKKNTKWRGGDATTIIEEFKCYGLSKTICYIIGFIKISLAILLLVSIKLEELTLASSLGLAILLLGSILMHLKIQDPLFKSFPAFLFVVMNLIIAYFSY
jgi:hypothetical protein